MVTEENEFKTGETVLYTGQGVFKINGTEIKRLGGCSIKYLVLLPLNKNDPTIYIPCENKELMSKLRHILSAEEIYQLIDEVGKTEPVWIENENERKDLFSEIIREGDRKKLMLLIRSVWLHGAQQQKSGRRLHQSDEAQMKQAEHLLYTEFASVLNIKPEDVVPLITTRLANGGAVPAQSTRGAVPALSIRAL